MKLIIDRDLVFRQTPDRFGDWREGHWKCIDNILNEYSVQYTRGEEDGSVVLTIFAQKVTLGEIAMNHLFYDILSRFFDISSLRYGELGGYGCGFAMRL